MPSLKEIKNRIQSVRSTRKITSAMMMISSSKLRKIQKIIENLYPYQQKLHQLMELFVNSQNDFVSPFAQQQPIKRVAIVAFSSNTSLAGRFNDNVINELKSIVNTYLYLGKENIEIYAIGDKVGKAARKMGFETLNNFRQIADKPSYEATQQLASDLMDMFLKKKFDKVELIYHHYKSKSSQELVCETFLPITLNTDEDKWNVPEFDYIVEPDPQTIMNQLIPKTLKLKLYTAHADSVSSEHAARTIAMQTATDNADDLLDELTLQYNKLRQQSITNELLDIIGGSFGREG
ncbi:MAG: F0F1 ATP synthase subunit gamma [Petrimonas sp.]